MFTDFFNSWVIVVSFVTLLPIAVRYLAGVAATRVVFP